jgi:hypothetical protein
MGNDFLDSAIREEARLVRLLSTVRAVIAGYRGDVATGGGAPLPAEDKKPRSPRAQSKASEVVGIAEEYLSKKGSRAPSTEIYEEVRRLGVEVPGIKPDSVVSSYLSNSPKFNNIRGQGYGLNAWKGHQTNEAPASEPEEAP